MQQVTKDEFDVWRERVDHLLKSRTMEAGTFYGTPPVTRYIMYDGTTVARHIWPLLYPPPNDSPDEYWIEESFHATEAPLLTSYDVVNTHNLSVKLHQQGMDREAEMCKSLSRRLETYMNHHTHPEKPCSSP